MRKTTEHSLIFCAEMIRALLAGRKTQTRRLVTKHNSRSVVPWNRLVWDGSQPDGIGNILADNGPSPAGNPGPYLQVPCRPHLSDPQDDIKLWTKQRIYPRYQMGDRIWVRETWCRTAAGGVQYRADRRRDQLYWSPLRWRSPIHMPRTASRITLELTSVRAQRIQDISEQDASAEGRGHHESNVMSMATGYRATFGELWDSLNAKRGAGWSVNPCVWALTFRVVEVKGNG